MQILLPPSETKRSGGEAVPLDWSRLTNPSLTTQRQQLAKALTALGEQPDVARAVLKLGRTQLGEIDRNRELLSAPTLPVIDRYTGVLFDGLDAGTLTKAQRAFAHVHLRVHSALFGPVGALDPIPAYRLSCDSRIPHLTLHNHTLKKHWHQAIQRLLEQGDELLLDLRSEGYVLLGPRPVRANSVYLRVVVVAPDGHKRALNHFNKKSKGEFTRWLLREQHNFGTVVELVERARAAGIRLEPGDAGQLELTVEQQLAAPGRKASSTIYTGVRLGA
jgi:hypothetical protein